MNTIDATIRQAQRPAVHGLLASVAIVAFAATAADAQRYVHDVPPDTEGIEIIERLDERIA
jgi:hypothetical protein